MEDYLIPRRILVIYTGGTIGMMQAADHAYLTPVDFQNIRRYLPEVDRLSCEIEFVSFSVPIDSSNMSPEIWIQLAELIEVHYASFDGFVILHGTDTMAYTSSALSFMLEGLQKPVILTGAQLPVAVIRTDARENLINSLEIAAHQQYRVPEVGVVFDAKMFRGNRCMKYSSETFQAFVSPLYPPLVQAGVDLEFFPEFWNPVSDQPFQVHKSLESNVALIKFYPGIPEAAVRSVLDLPEIRGVVLETYGSGSMPGFNWLIDALKERIDSGLIVVNNSQCPAGKVTQERYKNSNTLQSIGVLSGRDMTISASLTKLMYLLGRYDDLHEIKRAVVSNLRGELTLNPLRIPHGVNSMVY
jgi:L-asparaginase